MLFLFCVLLLALAVALTELGLRSRGDTTTMLERRLARGDISFDEYGSRVAMLRAIPEAP